MGVRISEVFMGHFWGVYVPLPASSQSQSLV